MGGAGRPAAWRSRRPGPALHGCKCRRARHGSNTPQRLFAPKPTDADRAPDQPAGAGTPHYHGHRERLRERFRQAGADALSDYELMEMVLFRAIPRRDVKPLAKSLIARFGSFAEA